MRNPLRFRAALTGLPALLVLFLPSAARALQNGQNFGCPNCHEGQNKPQVVAMFSAERIEPGQSVDLTVTTTHPSAVVGGVLVDSKGVGSFEIVDPMETHFFGEMQTQVVHVEPKAFTDGQMAFEFRWIAPDTVGPVEFEIWGNAANGNLDPHDDSALGIIGNVAVGCDAQWYYVDEDGDGFGDDYTGVYSCEALPGVNQGGDCEDGDPAVNAGVTEVCNDIDDNCDGEVDEGFEKQLWAEDADGDGFGAGAQVVISCAGPEGYGVGFDDCNDEDPNVYPGATELMNGTDDNCNGETDEMMEAAGGAPAVPPGPAMPTGPATTSGPAPTAPAMSSAPVTPPAGNGGSPSAPPAVPSMDPAPAPTVAPSSAGGGGSSGGCSVGHVKPTTPLRLPALIAGLALLALGRRPVRQSEG